MQSGQSAAIFAAQSPQHGLSTEQVSFGHVKVVFACVQTCLSAQHGLVQSGPQAPFGPLSQAVFFTQAAAAVFGQFGLSHALLSHFDASAHACPASSGQSVPSQMVGPLVELVVVQPTMSEDSAMIPKSAIFFI
ncbi:hypothetical protein COB72_04860 [bacterium]|nr:MAG: hypothetical protein COB72_04860 [bacterium]